MMKKIKLKPLLLASLATITLSGCATIDEKTGERIDHIEGFNRAMWKVNYDYLDPYILRPLAIGWRDYLPSPVTASIINVANNLDEPATIANYALQGKGEKAMLHLTRFWVNSIFGLGGLINWADRVPSLQTEAGIERRFGDTLGYYGVDTGFYTMLPVYGAATPRQELGGIADYFYPMYSLIELPYGLLKYVIQAIDKRANALDKDAILAQSQDPYIAFREAYFQHLDFRINGIQTEIEVPKLSEEILEEID